RGAEDDDLAGEPGRARRRRRGDGGAAIGRADLVVAAGVAGALAPAEAPRHSGIVRAGERIGLGEHGDARGAGAGPTAKGGGQAAEPALDGEPRGLEPVREPLRGGELHVAQLRLLPDAAEMPTDRSFLLRPEAPSRGCERGVEHGLGAEITP